MMVLDRAARRCEDRAFGEISQLLQPDDLLVFNNTKVFPARLLGRRRGITAQPVGKNNPAQRGFLTGETELFLTRQESRGHLAGTGPSRAQGANGRSAGVW